MGSSELNDGGGGSSGSGFVAASLLDAEGGLERVAIEVDVAAGGAAGAASTGCAFASVLARILALWQVVRCCCIRSGNSRRPHAQCSKLKALRWMPSTAAPDASGQRSRQEKHTVAV